MAKSSKSKKVSKSNKLVTENIPAAVADALASDDIDNALARSSGKPVPFSDSFTTEEATFSVEVKDPWGEVTEDIEVKIDCGGSIHGDEALIDLLIEMLENAKENLAARRPKITRKRLRAL
jgi:hypothetical protein